jgi:hypothetical protein
MRVQYKFIYIHNQKPEINLNDHKTFSSHLIKHSISNTQTSQLKLFKEIIEMHYEKRINSTIYRGQDSKVLILKPVTQIKK